MPKFLRSSTKNYQELSRGIESPVNMDSPDSFIKQNDAFSTHLEISVKANSEGSHKPPEFVLREPTLILSKDLTTDSNLPKNAEISDSKGNGSNISSTSELTQYALKTTIFGQLDGQKSSLKKRKMDGSSSFEEDNDNEMDFEPEELDLASKTCLEVVSETLSSLTLFLTNKNIDGPGNLRDACLKVFNKLTKKMSIMDREISNLKEKRSKKLVQSRDIPFTSGQTSFAQIVKGQKADVGGRSGSAQSLKKVPLPGSNPVFRPVDADTRTKREIQPAGIKRVTTATNIPQKNVAQTASKPAAKPKPKPSFKPRFDCKDYSRTLIIKGEDALKKIKEGIKPSSLNVSIDLCRENPNKEVVLKMSSSADADKMSLEIKGKFSDFTIRKPSQLAPRFEVLGLSLDTKEEDILHTVLTNNQEILEDSGLKLVRLQKNPRNMTAVFEASGAAFKRVIDKGKIKTEWQVLKVRESLNVDRCFKCLEFGHLKKDCKATLTCHRCASQEHVAKNCEVVVRKCVVCVKHNSQFKTQLNTEHSCLDAQCPLLVRRLAIKKAKVNYDAMMPTSHEGDMDTSGC
jgi:hypothetical protein